MKRCFLSLAIVVSAALLVLATPAPVHASYTSTVSGAPGANGGGPMSLMDLSG